MALYHRDIYIPKIIVNKTWHFDTVSVSRHARDKADERGIVINMQDIRVVHGLYVVEAEFDKGVLVKIVVRKRYNCTHDICYVLRYDFHSGLPVLITVWLNSADDNHSTLDESVYEKE